MRKYDGLSVGDPVLVSIVRQDPMPCLMVNFLCERPFKAESLLLPDMIDASGAWTTIRVMDGDQPDDDPLEVAVQNGRVTSLFLRKYQVIAEYERMVVYE